MNFDELIEKRRSIRKFLNDSVDENQIEELIRAAATAPSGCNSQCWKFVAVKSPDKIKALAEAVEKGVHRFYNGCEENFVASRVKQTTFFRNAPLVILVYLTEMKYHDPRVTDYYSSKGYGSAEMLSALGNPDILSIGAAVENLLLKAEEMGLGACWMNDPVVAEKEINELFGAAENHRLMSVIPVGKPAYTPREKSVKPLAEIMEIV
ncbi:MAG: nitroreductase family protein [Oscillospiraceae bacterium]|nr:nitroreductase family protein [Oscillospiraceae bacterium]